MPKRNLKYDHDVDHCRPLPSIVDETGTLKDEIKLSDFENDLFYEKTRVNEIANIDIDAYDEKRSGYISLGGFGNKKMVKCIDVLPEAEYEAGKTYNITVNDTSYSMIFTSQYDGQIGGYYYGFGLSTTTDGLDNPVGSGECDFLIIAHNGMWNTLSNGQKITTSLSCYFIEDTTFPVNVQIRNEESELKQIEPKYIPGVLIVETDTVYYVKDDLLGKAIKTAVQNGQMVCIYYNDTYYYPVNIKLNVYNYGQTLVTVAISDGLQFSFKV